MSDKLSWAEHERAGFTREEFLEDRHAAYLARMTTGQRFRRWVRLYSGQLWLFGILLAVIAVLCWVEYA